MISIKLPRDQKEELIQGIQEYFEKEGLEAIGNLQAESLLEFFSSGGRTICVQSCS
ncbi:hypothetical protein GCM10020331_058370 [Ectobacillus funiculus]